jgi:hypothetical protein
VASDVERFDLLGFSVSSFGGGADAAFSVQQWRPQAGAGGIPIHLATGPATYLTVMSSAGFERYLIELAYGLQHAATEGEAAALRERLSQVYDITVVGPPPGTPARLD